MNLLLLKPEIIAAGVVAASLVSFGSGWAVENWRNGAEIEKLRGQNTLLSTAGGKCEIDVQNVRTAMQALKAETEERVRKAEEAMKQAQPQVETRTKVITQIKTLPSVALDMQCEAIKQEQAEYITWRKQL